jgi:nitrogenase molybdenum-iron protein NifN
MISTAETPMLEEKSYATNACKLCAPLGASLLFKGIKNCVPIIHGSQGCATYIRRYLISHYREPIDIASSNFTESSAVFGGRENFFTALDNIIQQYNPEVIGICSTCLSETIGDDVPMFLSEYKRTRTEIELPLFVCASTPSYSGTHMEGFNKALSATVKGLAAEGLPSEHINIFPGFVSPADMRHIKEIFSDFGLKHIMLPDLSESLDNEIWSDYKRISDGGTSYSDISKMASAKASIEFARLNKGFRNESGADFLEGEFGVENHTMDYPIGINASDCFFSTLEDLSGKDTPQKYKAERGRLVDAYVDGHKYLFNKKAVVYGEEDLVTAIVAFLNEIGIETAICGSGGNSGSMSDRIPRMAPNAVLLDDSDFEEIDKAACEIKPDILIGNSKGYPTARKLGIPLIRVGFPVHDRVGSQRIKTLGYQGTQELFDKVVNALIEHEQDSSPVGYKYY